MKEFLNAPTSSINMSIIDFYQKKLQGPSFSQKPYTNWFTFVPTINSDSGQVVIRRTGERVAYKLHSLSTSSASIESAFFDGQFKVSISTFGFKLYDNQDQCLYEYVEAFWIENEKLIESILTFLQKNKQYERCYYVDELLSRVSESLSNTPRLDDRKRILIRIMQMLMDTQTVNWGERGSDRCIGYAREVDNAIAEKTFMFST